MTIKRVSKDGTASEILKSNLDLLKDNLDYGKGPFGILDDSLKMSDTEKFRIKKEMLQNLPNQKNDEALLQSGVVTNKTIAEVEDEDVAFVTPKFNELTLEPPKLIEEVPTLDFNKLAEKLIEIDDKQKNDDQIIDGFINESKLEFTDISSEQYRIYEFNNGKTIMIVEPQKLNVSKSGGHRLYDSSGTSHYIPQGWIHLSWRAKPNQPNFVK